MPTSPSRSTIITCDASFIGLATVLPASLALAAEKAQLVALVKPQFEAGPSRVGKGGVVRDPAVHREVCESAAAWVAAAARLGGGRDRRKPDPRPRGQPRIPALCPPRCGESRDDGRHNRIRRVPAGSLRLFQRSCKTNNDPAWFKPRKALYEAEVLAPFRELIVAVGEALGQAGLPLVGDPRRGIFRIYRDVRFSPDKRLYKTHAGAVLTRSGGRREPGRPLHPRGAGRIDGGGGLLASRAGTPDRACGGLFSPTPTISSRSPTGSPRPVARCPATIS